MAAAQRGCINADSMDAAAYRIAFEDEGLFPSIDSVNRYN
jgi:hypothetical protein